MKTRNLLILAFLLMLNINANAQKVEVWKNGFVYFTMENPDSVVFRPSTYEEIINGSGFHDTAFPAIIGRRYMEAMALSSDEFTSICFDGNYYDSGCYLQMSNHTYNSLNSCLDWEDELLDASRQLNQHISDTKDIQARAYFRALRALYTFIMMDTFGDAPIIDTNYCNAMGLNIDNRQKRSNVARWIESELLDITNFLPTETTGKNYGKPNRYMALALLAKLYINWPVYMAQSVDQYDATSARNEKLEDCIAVCDQIINAGKFALGPDAYRFKFNHDNTSRVQTGTIKDFIYAVKYDTNGIDGYQGMQWGRSHIYKDAKSMDPSYFGERLNMSAGGYMPVTPECVHRFCLPGDERNFMLAGLCDKDGNDAAGQVYVYDNTTLLPTQEIAYDRSYSPLVFTKTINVSLNAETNDVGENLEGWRQGYHSVKWFVCDEDYSNGRNQSNDVPIFRYADILLIKAEAMVRSSRSGAKDLFNQIRSYVNAPTLSSDPTLDDIYEERGREFFDELWRRNDMIRFGHFEDAFFSHYQNNPQANFDKTRRIFPIQQGLLDKNTTWTQNPGY